MSSATSTSALVPGVKSGFALADVPSGRISYRRRTSVIVSEASALAWNTIPSGKLLSTPPAVIVGAVCARAVCGATARNRAADHDRQQETRDYAPIVAFW